MNNEVKPDERLKNIQPRINKEDIDALRSMFLNNERGLKTLRKVFYPELDIDAQLFNQNIDMYSMISTKDRAPEQIAIELSARNMLLNHIEACLTQIYVLVGQETDTAEDIINRQKQAKLNSAR